MDDLRKRTAVALSDGGGVEADGSGMTLTKIGAHTA
jgi:hypothetical protein